MQKINNAEFMVQITQQAIYLMGICFVLGSLFTIFVLLILEMVRAGKTEHRAMLEQQQVEKNKAANHEG